MYKEISFNTFVDEFKMMNRDSYSHEGYRALYDYFQMLEEDMGEKIEFDAIAICCDYTEYETRKELINAYNHLDDINTVKDIRDYTTVIKTEKDSYIIRDF